MNRSSHERMKPAVTALLKAIDQTMNGSTFLLKVQTDEPLTASNCRDALSDFLRSPLFQTMMLEQDQQRGLDIYMRWDIADDGTPVPYLLPGNFLKDHFELVLSSLDERQFVERLHWMLREAFSPYQTQKTEEQAQKLIGDFFWEVFAPESWPLDAPSASLYWKTHPWSFSAVKPDFLYDTGYYENREIDAIPLFAYFDGGPADSCTFFYEADIFYLLFTNGSP